MILFSVWIIISILFLSLCILFVWRRSRRGSRFKAKLTVFFLLFVLVPAVPLTFFVATLITRSADFLLLPGMDDALDTSLGTIRTQLEERGKRFLQQYPNSFDWTPRLLEERGIGFAGLYSIRNDTIFSVRRVCRSRSSLFKNFRPHQESLSDALTVSRTSSLVSIGNKSVITVYHSVSDSTIALASYPVPPSVLEAKDKIIQALGTYNTFSLLKESIIQKKLIWGAAVILVLGLSFLSVIAARKLSRGISEPIQNLVYGMQQVSKGNLSYQVETRAKDEFRFLVDSFNKMIQELELNRQKLIYAERLAAWQEVARRISHEIKNSLTPTSISLHRLRTHLQGEPLTLQITETLDTIEEELHSLEKMAKEFSEFARMPQPDKFPIDLNEVIRSVIHLIGSTAGRVKIKTDIHPDIPSFNGDREQMKRLFINLIKNGIEASHDTGTLTITTRAAKSSQHSIEVEVSDEGEGIKKDVLKNIFTPYYTTKKKGTGLGLTIVQKIVEDHNGEIGIESEKGKGTRVRVLL